MSFGLIVTLVGMGCVILTEDDDDVISHSERSETTATRMPVSHTISINFWTSWLRLVLSEFLHQML